MPGTDLDQAEEARVLYVAMTRAMDELVMTCHRPSGFVQRLDDNRLRDEGVLSGSPRTSSVTT
jgi:superfamily I DNA/RNA helicase